MFQSLFTIAGSHTGNQGSNQIKQTPMGKREEKKLKRTQGSIRSTTYLHCYFIMSCILLPFVSLTCRSYKALLGSIKAERWVSNLDGTRFKTAVKLIRNAVRKERRLEMQRYKEIDLFLNFFPCNNCGLFHLLCKNLNLFRRLTSAKSEVL